MNHIGVNLFLVIDLEKVSGFTGGPYDYWNSESVIEKIRILQSTAHMVWKYWK